MVRSCENGYRITRPSLSPRASARRGALLQHIVEAGAKAGHGPDLATWSGQAIALAVEETKTFEAQAGNAGRSEKEVA